MMLVNLVIDFHCPHSPLSESIVEGGVIVVLLRVGGCHCSHVCEPSYLCVCHQLVVCGPTHGIRVIVVQLSLLGGIRRSSSLGWICRCWSSLGGFIVMGLDLLSLVLLHWVGCLAIACCWGIFTGVGLGWVDSLSLAVVGPSSLDVIRHESSLLEQVRRRWSLLGSSCPCWSCSRWPFVFGQNSLRLVVVGLDLPAWVLQLSWFHPPSSPRVLLLRHLVLPSSPTSFPLLLPPHFLLLHAHIPFERGGAADAAPRF